MSILEKLSVGDMRSTGRSNEIVKEVLAKPSMFKELFDCLYSSDAGVRMRSADALEKVTLKMPALLKPFKNALINELSVTSQQEVMWHLAQLYPRLELSKSERDKITGLLFSWIKNSKSNIVKVFSMQALFDFSRIDSGLKPKVISVINELMKTKIPSLVSRARKLLKEF